ncbi:MAG: hypothetical protein AAGA11_08960 [Pseudomonadota bacterium]
MSDTTSLIWLLACAFALCGVYAVFRSQRLRADIERGAEGSMLGAEFGAFGLPQAELAPDETARRRCRSWSIGAAVAIACSVTTFATGFLI